MGCVFIYHMNGLCEGKCMQNEMLSNIFEGPSHVASESKDAVPRLVLIKQ